MSHNVVFYDHMRSSIGRNIQMCCDRLSLADATDSLFSIRDIDDVCRDKVPVDDEVIRNVECSIELVIIRDNMLQLSSDVF